MTGKGLVFGLKLTNFLYVAAKHLVIFKGIGLKMGFGIISVSCYIWQSIYQNHKRMVLVFLGFICQSSVPILFTRVS